LSRIDFVAPLRFQYLSRQHDRNAFDCGTVDQNQYLKQQARQDADKRLSRTFVLVGEEEAQICAYYTLTPSFIDFEEMPTEKRLSRYPAPVTLLAQLAVDVRFQKRGLGELLLFDVMARSAEIARHTGQFAVILDAREDNLIEFYAQYGFVRASSSEHPRRMYLKMSVIQALALAPAPIVP
jgi:predicted N-acetyltransferase YhbS